MEHVVLLGAGYISVWAYRALTRWVGRRVRITVVAPVKVHVYHGWTGEVLSGELPPEAQGSPIAEAMPRAVHVHGWARQVDRAARTVRVECHDGSTQVLHYDHLVVGTGTTENIDSIPGLKDYAFRLRDDGCAGALAAHLDRCITEAGSIDDPERRQSLLSVVLAGGGLAGVESSAAIAQRLAKATGLRPGRTGAPRVTLVSAAETLARELRPAGRARVFEELRHNGVNLLLSNRVTRVYPDGVKLEDGLWLPAVTTVCVVGNRSRPLPGLDDLPVDAAGRLIADRYLQIAPHVWSGGDAASVPLKSGRPCPLDAGWAIGQGTWIGRNIARTVRHRSQRAFAFKSVGAAVAFGKGHGVMEAWGVQFGGRLAWAARAAFFVSYMPSRQQARRVIGMALRRGGPRAAVRRRLPDSG